MATGRLCCSIGGLNMRSNNFRWNSILGTAENACTLLNVRLNRSIKSKNKIKFQGALWAPCTSYPILGDMPYISTGDDRVGVCVIFELNPTKNGENDHNCLRGSDSPLTRIQTSFFFFITFLCSFLLFYLENNNLSSYITVVSPNNKLSATVYSDCVVYCRACQNITKQWICTFCRCLQNVNWSCIFNVFIYWK